VQTNTPRFSAYVASKAALDAFSRCMAPEVIGDGVNVTTVYMPLVRTPMIAPTSMYDAFPTLSPEEAAQLVADAILDKPKRVATRLGTFGQILYSVSPKAVDQIMHTAYRIFPDSKAARKDKEGEAAPAGDGQKKEDEMSTEAVAMAYLLRGVHF
jgi:short-subunit dehydrogenase